MGSPREVQFPEFELVSCPTINIKELRSAMDKGDISKVKITDTVTGKVTTVGAAIAILDEYGIDPKFFGFDEWPTE